MGQASASGAAFMADAYSFGVIIWEIYTGKLPWEGISPMHIAIMMTKQQRRLETPPQCPPEIKVLLAACWEHEPTMRPTMKQIEAGFPEKEEEREHTRAAPFTHGPSAYSLSSQLTLSVPTSQVRGGVSAPFACRLWVCGLATLSRALWVGSYSLCFTFPRPRTHASAASTKGVSANSRGWGGLLKTH